MSSSPLDRQIDVADAELARQRTDYAGVLNNPALSETIQGIVRSLGMRVQRGMRTQQDLVEALAEPALPCHAKTSGRSNFSQDTKRISVLTLSFRNPAGSYDDVKRRVRFLGHDALSEKDPWAYAMIALPHALPAAIGGKIAAAEIPVAVSAGDGGFQFTLQELGTAVENKLPLAIILWDNNSLAQIRDGMMERNIPTIGVNQRNPDFGALAKACGCYTAEPEHYIELEAAVTNAFRADGATIIHLRESAEFLA